MSLNNKIKRIVMALSASAILSFGLYHIHSMSGVTEGGILGLTLFLHHWFDISPSLSGFVLNAICYLVGWRVLGREFILWSILSGGGFSAFYAIFEQFDPLWPQLAEMPLLAAILGAIFVGVGAGLSVRAGGAPCGDDALAMILHRVVKWKIQWCYLVSDFIVLALSITYIPFSKLMCSFLTVILSGQLVGLVQKAIQLESGKKAIRGVKTPAYRAVHNSYEK